MNAGDVMLWVGLFLLAYAVLTLLVPVVFSLKRASVRRRYLADCTRKRLALPSDDTGPLTVAGCGDCEEPCQPEACGASSWRRGAGERGGT